MKKRTAALICLLTTFTPVYSVIANSPASFLASAPDSTLQGPHQIASGDYRLAPSIDPDILSDRMTEIWAKVFYPKNLAASEKAPLIVLLHGNHATCGTGVNPRRDSSCEYTYSGSCPTGYVPVPNHEGYNYLAENLASWGYIVVSVNANRGITCGGGVSGDYGLNLARGKLVLKHLSLLYKWSTEGGAPASLGLGAQGLVGKINFDSVGLLGHSRGGEGIRAAYNLYRDAGSAWPARIPGLSMKALFEIGAVDGQTSRQLNAPGTVWNQLLPMCDGDVSDLQGRYPFERMLLTTNEPAHAQKSLYEVWGANHNFFNTEWQQSDAWRCSVGKPIFDVNGSASPEQQRIALASVSAFFRSRLGTAADGAYNQNFNPLDTLPDVVTQTTQVDRDFTPSPGAGEAMIIDDFDQKTGTSTSGNVNKSSQVDIQHRGLVSSHVQRVAAISWKAASDTTFFESVWAPEKEGRDLNGFATLDFRIARQGKKTLNPSITTDFSIKLEDASGKFSEAIQVSNYAYLNGPGSGGNDVLKAVRIPLSAFKGIDLSKVHGVKFVFDKTETGAIYLANLRAHKQRGFGSANAYVRTSMLTTPISARHMLQEEKPIPEEYVSAELNSLRVMQTRSLTGEPVVEVRVASKVPFPAMNRLPVLKIGDKEFKLSRYSDLKELKEMTFTLTPTEYQAISQTDDVTVADGKIWKFGNLKGLK